MKIFQFVDSTRNILKKKQVNTEFIKILKQKDGVALINGFRFEVQYE